MPLLVLLPPQLAPRRVPSPLARRRAQLRQVRLPLPLVRLPLRVLPPSAPLQPEPLQLAPPESWRQAVLRRLRRVCCRRIARSRHAAHALPPRSRTLR